MTCALCDRGYCRTNRLTRDHDLEDGGRMLLCEDCIRYLRTLGARTWREIAIEHAAMITADGRLP